MVCSIASSMHVCTTIVIIHEQGDYHEMGYSNGHSVGNHYCMCSSELHLLLVVCSVVHMHVPIYKCTVYRVCVYVL